MSWWRGCVRHKILCWRVDEEELVEVEGCFLVGPAEEDGEGRLKDCLEW